MTSSVRHADPQLRPGTTHLHSGPRVGVVALECAYPYFVGNVQNARSFRFPVAYESASGVTLARIMKGEAEAGDAVVAAARRLQARGASVVVGACGSFGHYQTRVADSLEIPAFMSILTQVPFLLRALPRSARLGIVFASARSYTELIRRECGIDDDAFARTVAISACDVPAFAPILEQRAGLDGEALERELVELLVDARRRYPEIGAWLLQCSDLPPFRAAIQHATGRPVFDMTLLIEHLEQATGP